MQTNSTMWKMDQDETYFRIFDPEGYIAGYFDPHYGDGATDEYIEAALKRKNPVPGGFLVVPMIKFGLFDTDLNIDIETLESRIESTRKSLARWSNYMKAKKYPFHSIRISHTDQDMLTMTFPIMFPKPTRLDRKDLINEIYPVMESLQRIGLI